MARITWVRVMYTQSHGWRARQEQDRDGTEYYTTNNINEHAFMSFPIITPLYPTRHDLPKRHSLILTLPGKTTLDNG